MFRAAGFGAPRGDPAVDRGGVRPGRPRPAPQGVPDRRRAYLLVAALLVLIGKRLHQQGRTTRSGTIRTSKDTASFLKSPPPTAARPSSGATGARRPTPRCPGRRAVGAPHGRRQRRPVPRRRRRRGPARPAAARLPAVLVGLAAPAAGARRRGYRAAAMDLRGFGASDKPPRGYDPRTLAEDVSGVIRSLGERDAVVVGQGLGGLVAWTLAVVHPTAGTPPGRRVHAPPAAAAPLAPDRRPPAAGQPARHGLPAAGPARARAGRRRRRSRSPTCCTAGPALASPTTRPSAVPAGRADPRGRPLRAGVLPLGGPLDPRPDGLRYARRMASPVTVPTLQVHGALDRCVLPPAPRGPAATSRRPTGGT